MDITVQLSGLSEISDSGAASAPFQQSTKRLPAQSAEPRPPSGASGFKAPRPPVRRSHARKPPAKPPKAVCKDCGKPYLCLRSYRNHVRLHNVEKLASRYPDEGKIYQHIGEIDRKVLQVLSSCPAFGASGSVYKTYVKNIVEVSSSSTEWHLFRMEVCKKFIKATVGKKFLMPSSLLSSLIATADNVLASENHRQDLMECLEKVETVDVCPLNLLIADYVYKFMKELLFFISKCVRETEGQGSSVIVSLTLDEEDRQTIHYVGGSVMRGFLRMGQKYPGSSKWKSIVHIIRSRILENEHVPQASTSDKEWTLTVDRGGLLKINPQCQLFFIKVGTICYAAEKEDGSISYEDVLLQVHQSGAAGTWDVLVGRELAERESLNFMNAVVRSFCQTYGKGISKRRVNAERKKATTSLTLRHSIAPR